ncbi:HalOD1 output domain-containing protein [Halorientalis halophila]|uniref:HalOD1 output domain-containing protein n=1 Tax=Halorientalis halophila TaxID=3108499 RepID=UPI003AB66DCA
MDSDCTQVGTKGSVHQQPNPTDKVVRAVARAQDCTSTDLPPLAYVLDPEALDSLVQSGSTVKFEYNGHHVTVSPQEVTVRDT